MVQLLLNKTASFWALPVSEVGRSWLRICLGAAFAVGGGGGGSGSTVDSQKIHCRSGSAGLFRSSRSGSLLPSHTLRVQSIERN